MTAKRNTPPSKEGDEATESAPPTPSTPSDSEDEASETSTASISDDRWRTQDIVFAFGPEKSYFMSASLGRWRYWGKKQIADSFDENDINTPIAVAFSAEGDYVFVYEESDGSMTVSHSQHNKMISSRDAAAFVEARKQYSKLYDFVRFEKENDVRRMVSFSIGPGGSWFARRGDEVAYHQLPADLENEIKERGAKGLHPHQVALGMHGSYVAVWSDRSCSWSLHGYDGVKQYLNEKGNINTIALSPFNCNDFFLVRESGCVLWSLADDTNPLLVIQKDAYAFMQRKARRDGKTFNMIWNGKAIVVTPDTHFDTESTGFSRFSTIPRQTGLFKNGDLLSDWPQWRWSKVPQAVSDKHTIIAIGAAAATSAVLVGVIAYPPRRRAVTAASSSALATGCVTRVARMPVRRAAVTAGLAALGTGALCTWFSE